MDDVCVHECKQTSLAPLATNARLLVTTEDGLRGRLLPRVDEDGSSFQASCNLAGLLDIAAPDAGAETRLGVVGTGNDLLKVGPWLGGDNGAEGLLSDDARLVGRVVDDGRLNEEALAGCNIGLTDGELVALGLAVGEELLDLLILHGVLDGAEQVVAIVWVSDLDGLCEIDHLLQELLVNGLVNVDALGGDADLSRVLESAHDDFRSDLLDVDIGKDNGGVVAAKFQGDALQSLGRSLHNLLARCGRTGEGDLGNVWVCAHLRAKLVVAAHGLDDARGEEVLHDLDYLEASVRRERRGLDDDGVTRQEGRGDLANGKNQGEVPWDDTSANTEGSVLCVDGLLVVLEAILGYF